MVMYVGINSFHTHHYAVSSKISCVDCLHHIPHSGHLNNSVNDHDCCLICQLLYASYVIGEKVYDSDILFVDNDTYFYAPQKIYDSVRHIAHLRGPPSFLF